MATQTSKGHLAGGEVVGKALCAKEPKRRYSIGYMVGAAAILEAMPQSWADWILAKRF